MTSSLGRSDDCSMGQCEDCDQPDYCECGCHFDYGPFLDDECWDDEE